jgi:hypothetical protein
MLEAWHKQGNRQWYTPEKRCCDISTYPARHTIGILFELRFTRNKTEEGRFSYPVEVVTAAVKGDGWMDDTRDRVKEVDGRS